MADHVLRPAAEAAFEACAHRQVAAIRVDDANPIWHEIEDIG